MARIYDFDPTMANAKDFSAKYNNCVVLYQGRPVRVMAGNVDDGYVQLVRTDFETQQERMNKCETIDPLHISPWYPTPGWYLFPDGMPRYLQRHARRQWRRSLHWESYSLNLPYDPWIVDRVAWNKVDDRYDSLLAPRYWSIEDAVEMLQKNKVFGVPLSQEFCLCRYSHESTLAIVSNNGIVGFFNVETRTATLSQFLMQELKDALMSNKPQKGNYEWTMSFTHFLD